MLETLKATLDILFPPACIICGRKVPSQSTICAACGDFKTMPSLVCQKCARPLKTSQTLCSYCRTQNNYFFDRVVVPFIYQNPLAQILKLFKYHHYSYLADLLKDRLVDFILHTGFDYKKYDFITYVPMHKTKLREREYNQSELLAQKLSQDLGIKLKAVLEAQYYLKPQAAKNKNMRQEEIKGNFRARQSLAGASIILVDDVVTTGSTASECARALKEKGAKEVTVWSIARSINENPA